jgi:Lysozyme like domain
VKRDDEQALVLLFVVFVLAKLRDPLERAEQALEDAGAKAYEWLHPSQRGHMDDLPGHQWTKQALMSLAARHGFPDPLLAAAIALAESGGVPGALGDNRESVGLWQIHMPSWPQFNYDDMRDPEKNAAAAMVISKQGTDWRPWSTFRNGTYRRFM